MITFNNITIQNFLSFGHKPTEINLCTDDNTLILGQNRDVGTEGYSRNGTGKSSIFQALTWVLFGEGITPIKQDAFVNIINKKNMVVTLNMTVGDIQFIIRRGRKPAICEVLKDGEPYTMHSSSTVDDTIQSLLGINFDTWCNTILLNTATVPFMGMKPAPQRDFMEKMVGLDVLSERAMKLKAKNKDLLVDIKLEEQNKSHIEEVYTKTKSRVAKLSTDCDDWLSTNKTDIKELNSEIKQLGEIDTDKVLEANIEIRKVSDEIKSFRTLIDQNTYDKDKALGLVKVKYESDKKDIETEHHKSQVKNESEYNLDIASIKSDYKDKKAQASIESSEKHLKLITDKSEIEKTLTEHKVLLKESMDFIKSSTLQLRTLVGSDTKLTEEREILAKGECPYCHQSHVDEKRMEQILSELKDNDADANEIGGDCDRVQDGMEQVKEDITSAEESLVDVIAEIEGISDIINKSNTKFDDNMEIELTQLDEDYTRTLSRHDGEQSLSYNKIDIIMNTETESINNEYDDIESNYNDRIIILSETLSEEEYSDEECREVVFTLKQLDIRLDKLVAEPNPYNDQLDSATADLIEYNDDALEHMYAKADHYKILIKLLTDNKSYVRMNLLSQYIPYLNGKIDEYKTRLDLPHDITINNDLTVDMEYMQSTISYNNMSNGEKNRCNFAVSMAFRDLLQVSGHQFNFLGIDEVLDNGLDTSGFSQVFKIIEGMGDKSIFLISHRDDLIKDINNTLNVIKENGFTRITERPNSWNEL
ncbi:AAA family ATPase [Candidatus Babeliales bacterium]|nr:AAA family ATPase [Candidatus Babeliales bacterium]